MNPNQKPRVFSKTDFVEASATPRKGKDIDSTHILSSPAATQSVQTTKKFKGESQFIRRSSNTNNLNSVSHLREFYENRNKQSTANNGWVPTLSSSKPASNITAGPSGANSNLQLSSEQQEIARLIDQGKSVFFTGAAGTGKSTLLRWIIEHTAKQGTYVTASTGIAAINIGGTTIHSFAGIKRGTESKENLLAMVQSSFTHKTNWLRAKILVIDEISMIDRDLFEKLNFIAKEIRKSDAPFGGIQMICTGDFFQLPPVEKSGFCFESPLWKKTFDFTYQLQRVFRQSSDQNFLAVLNELRVGTCSERTIQLLQDAQHNFPARPQGIEPTILFPRNKNVDEYNNTKLAELSGKGKLYKARDSGSPAHREMLETMCPVPSDLKIKLGAQVMLVKTSHRSLDRENGLVNGMRGIVTGFDDTNRGFPVVLFTNKVERTIESTRFAIEQGGVEVAYREQVPLKLAWAISIHKCQGSTITCAEMSMEGIWEYGQAYVALSRVSSLASLRLSNFDPKAIRANPKVIDFYNSLQTVSGDVPLSPIRHTPTTYAFKAEYARSGRATCRHCAALIGAHELRIGEHSVFRDHTSLKWYHTACFFSSGKVINDVNQIEGWDLLKQPDKERLGKLMGVTDLVQTFNPAAGLDTIKENFQKTTTAFPNDEPVHQFNLDSDEELLNELLQEEEQQKHALLLQSTSPQDLEEEKRREQAALERHESFQRAEECRLAKELDDEEDQHFKILNPQPAHLSQRSSLAASSPLPILSSGQPDNLSIFQAWKLQKQLNNNNNNRA